MKKIIYLVFAFFAFATASNAQVISMIGDGVSGWGTDVNMTTTDNVHYTLSGFTFSDGSAKFRQDGGWAINWGASSFPMGTGTPNGNNIPVVAGVFDVTFNLTTKAYAFTPVALGYPDISVYGTANSNMDGVMNTTDGVTYRLNNYALSLGDLVFRQDMANVNTFSSASFPSGTATAGGAPISVIPGTYNITFNLSTGIYSFNFATISIRGSGLAGWDTDVDMETTDGINYSMNMTAFSTGEVKFRQDYSWAFNWGASAFPSGTASLNGNNINTIAGNYVVAFNRSTGAFSFSSNFPVISLNNGAADIDMVTFDGDNYFLNNYAYTAGNYKFRQGNANTFVWGASTFPNGTAETYITTSIPVPSKSFNVTFNKTTGVYAFSFVTIGIIGDATPGGWGADTIMSTVDGINYTLSNTALTNNSVKFRQGQDWSTNWGSNSFPMGTGNYGGNNIAVSESSIYNITFNMQTGAFNFADIFKSKVRNNQCGTVLATLNQAIKAVIIPTATRYRYEVTQGATATVFESNKASFSLTQLAGSTYNSVYLVRVAVRIDGVWRGYGASCEIFSPTILSSSSIPTTSLRTTDCGSTLASLGTPIHSKLVYAAEAYRFRLTFGSNTTEYETPIYYFFLTDLANSLYGTTYNIQVAVKIAGIWGNYGAECPVTTPVLSASTIPTTQIRPSFCNTTLAALNTKIPASLVYNSGGYRFEITTGGVITIYNSPIYLTSLSDAGVVVANGMTYAIRVAANVGDVYGNYGASCTIMTPAGSGSSRQMAEDQLGATSDFKLTAYPNPSNSAFNIQIANANDTAVSVLVFDMMGRQVENKVINATELENVSLGQNYSTGIYNVIVSQGNTTKTVRLIKN
jgi:hypothetical protein